MGKTGRWLVRAAGFVLAGAAFVAAVERGTPTEARAMLDNAIAHYKAVGRTQALADFNKKAAPFSDRDLYVVCLAPDHTIARACPHGRPQGWRRARRLHWKRAS